MDAVFHFSQNEKTGDGYIKSTEENDHEPIVVSITTVSGRVQDLMLEVDVVFICFGESMKSVKLKQYKYLFFIFGCIGLTFLFFVIWKGSKGNEDLKTEAHYKKEISTGIDTLSENLLFIMIFCYFLPVFL